MEHSCCVKDAPRERGRRSLGRTERCRNSVQFVRRVVTCNVDRAYSTFLLLAFQVSRSTMRCFGDDDEAPPRPILRIWNSERGNTIPTRQHVVNGLVHVRGSVCETQPPSRCSTRRRVGGGARESNQLAPLASATKYFARTRRLVARGPRSRTPQSRRQSSSSRPRVSACSPSYTTLFASPGSSSRS